MQRGTVGDITAGLPLGPWTDALARTLMTQNERFWDEDGIAGSEREVQRREFSERYRRHIEAKDLYHCYIDYPYVEWYSESNGRVVLELDPSQVEIVDVPGAAPRKEKTPQELADDERKRSQAFGTFMGGMVEELSRQNRKKGGDGNVTGAVVS